MSTLIFLRGFEHLGKFRHCSPLCRRLDPLKVGLHLIISSILSVFRYFYLRVQVRHHRKSEVVNSGTSLIKKDFGSEYDEVKMDINPINLNFSFLLQALPTAEYLMEKPFLEKME